MSIALWILQVLMAAVFLFHGGFMVAPPAEMVEMINAQLTQEFRLFLGVAEILAAVGLILPGVTRILPWLVAAAGVGLMVVMASATVLHAFRGETSSAITTAVLFGLVTAVTYGRWKVKPIAPRKMSIRALRAQARTA
jgi:uncharacterized membrane protein YphA (DoxX/SURF4 family)